MAYPSTLSSFTNPNPSDRLNSPSHSGIETAQNTGLSEIQAFVGTLSSTAGTLMYDIRAAASDGGGHIQSANKGGTGQTQYNKGDILVAMSSSVLSKLAVGTDGQVLTSDSSQSTGIKWGAGVTPTVRVYSVASSVIIWNRPSTLSYAIIEVQGGGAGGGGNTTSGSASGGGGAGAYSRKMITFANLPIAASVFAGAGGAAGAGAGGTGSDGQVSYFASILVAQGGTGGTANNGGRGGTGGTSTGGDLNMPGGDGDNASNATDATGGNGGNAILGNGGRGGTDSDFSGLPGKLFGGGGGGAKSNGGADTAGSAGAQGVISIYEY